MHMLSALTMFISHEKHISNIFIFHHRWKAYIFVVNTYLNFVMKPQMKPKINKHYSTSYALPPNGLSYTLQMKCVERCGKREILLNSITSILIISEFTECLFTQSIEYSSLCLDSLFSQSKFCLCFSLLLCVLPFFAMNVFKCASFDAIGIWFDNLAIPL